MDATYITATSVPELSPQPSSVCMNSGRCRDAGVKHTDDENLATTVMQSPDTANCVGLLRFISQCVRRPFLNMRLLLMFLIVLCMPSAKSLPISRHLYRLPG